MTDTRKKVIESLKPKKKFNIFWMDEVNMAIEVKASSKEEAERMFIEGEIDFNKAEEGDTNFNEYSLEVEEVK